MSFNDLNNDCSFWTSTESNFNESFYRDLYYQNESIVKLSPDKIPQCTQVLYVHNYLFAITVNKEFIRYNIINEFYEILKVHVRNFVNNTGIRFSSPFLMSSTREQTSATSFR